MKECNKTTNGTELNLQSLSKKLIFDYNEKNHQFNSFNQFAKIDRNMESDNISGHQSIGSFTDIENEFQSYEPLIKPLDEMKVYQSNRNSRPSFSDMDSMKVAVKIYNGSDSYGITIPGFGGVQLGREEQCLIAYYIDYKIVSVGDVKKIYGVGYSVNYLFKKVRKGISVSNLADVAASVQLEKNETQVSYSIQTYGMNGVELTKFIKPVVNKNFDVSGYSIIQSAIDGIQNVLTNLKLFKTIKFTPVELTFLKMNDLS